MLLRRQGPESTIIDPMYGINVLSLYYKVSYPIRLERCSRDHISRLDANNFKPSKDQRRAVNRLSKYVLGSEYMYKVARLCPKTRE